MLINQKTNTFTTRPVPANSKNDGGTLLKRYRGVTPYRAMMGDDNSAVLNSLLVIFLMCMVQK
jgi:hypothetical protein